MPYIRLFYHITWSTKIRLPLITPDLEFNLFNYLVKKSSEIGCRILEVNGTEDHLHVIIEIPPKLSVSEAVKRLKGASSHEFSTLVWQRGYGAISVSERNISAALEYVRNQKDHHAQQTAIPRFERRDDEEMDNDSTVIKDEPGSYSADGDGLF